MVLLKRISSFKNFLYNTRSRIAGGHLDYYPLNTNHQKRLLENQNRLRKLNRYFVILVAMVIFFIGCFQLKFNFINIPIAHQNKSTFLRLFQQFNNNLSIDQNSSPIFQSFVLNSSKLKTKALKNICSLVPINLIGPLKVLKKINKSFDDLGRMFPHIELGGRFRSADCVSENRVAIIIPYRNREEHLKVFLHHMHPILMRQKLDYGIFVVEQFGNDRFNRAKLMNIGFVEASKQYQYDCFIFHDVDLIPEDDRNLYKCYDQPRHLSVAVDKFHYKLPYVGLFGGVGALTKQQFIKINGFSNEFWGWGAEDDDLSNRLIYHKLKIVRDSESIARYTMLKHDDNTVNAERLTKLYNGWKRFSIDGLNSLQYHLIDITFHKLYTNISVDVLAP